MMYQKIAIWLVIVSISHVVFAEEKLIKAKHLFQIGEKNSAESLLKEIVSSETNDEILLRAYNSLGYMHYSKNNYDTAQIYYLKGLEYKSKSKYYLTLLENIANVYYQTNSYNLAEKYYIDALALALKLKIYESVVIAKINLATINKIRNKYDLSKLYLLNSLSDYNKYKINNEQLLYLINLNLAEVIFHKEKDTSKSIQYLETAKKLNVKNKFELYLLYYTYTLNKVYIDSCKMYSNQIFDEIQIVCVQYSLGKILPENSNKLYYYLNYCVQNCDYDNAQIILEILAIKNERQHKNKYYSEIKTALDIAKRNIINLEIQYLDSLNVANIDKYAKLEYDAYLNKKRFNTTIKKQTNSIQIYGVGIIMAIITLFILGLIYYLYKYYFKTNLHHNNKTNIKELVHEIHENMQNKQTDLAMKNIVNLKSSFNNQY